MAVTTSITIAGMAVRTVLVTVCASILVPSMAIAGDIRVSYRIEQIEPRLKNVGTLTITRSVDRAELVYRALGRSWLTVFTPSFTLVGGPNLPSPGAALLPAEATGQLPFVPAFPNDFLTWAPLRLDPQSNQYLLVDLDVVQRGSVQFKEQASTTLEHLKGRIQSVSVAHNGQTATRWSYASYRKVDNWSLPGTITRERRKASGLNIAHDDVFRWTLQESVAITTGELSDENLILPGASVQDRRNLPWTNFKYQIGKGSIDAQAARLLGRAAASAGPSGDPQWFVALAAILGLVVGARSARRSFDDVHSNAANAAQSG